MSIEAATGVIALLLTIATTSLGMFVKNKIGDSEDKIMDLIARNYLPRELASQRFTEIDRRIDEFHGTRTPRRAYPTDEA